MTDLKSRFTVIQLNITLRMASRSVLLTSAEWTHERFNLKASEERNFSLMFVCIK